MSLWKALLKTGKTNHACGRAGYVKTASQEFDSLSGFGTLEWLHLSVLCRHSSRTALELKFKGDDK